MIPVVFFYALVTFIVLVITQEIFHRYPRFTLALFSTASVALFSCWILLVQAPDWFPWVKVSSIALGITVLSISRTTKFGNTKLFQWSIYLLLVFNIFEAVTRDIVTGNIANYLNAIAGILLIATLSKINTIHIDTKSKTRDLCWESMDLPWVIGYTLWNWLFIYLNYGFQSSIIHIAVLGAALITVFVDRDRWLQARVFTLATYFLIFHSTPHYLSLFTSGHSERFGLFISIITFGFMVVYASNKLLTNKISL